MSMIQTSGPAALVTLSTAMSELDTDADGYVSELILRASAAVETYCNRRFADDYVLPGQEGRTLPYDVEAAVLGIVRRAYHAAGRDDAIRSSNAEGLASFSYFDASNMPDLFAPLEPYRMRVAL